MIDILQRLLMQSTQHTSGANIKDDAGLSAFDIGPARAAVERGDETWAARILYKYRKTQLSESEKRKVETALHSAVPRIKISPRCEVVLEGRQPKEVFNRFVSRMKECKARYNPQDYSWRVKLDLIDDLIAWFGANGFLVLESPRVIEEEKVKVKEEHSKTVTMRYADGKICFRCAKWDEDFNLVFSNKVGPLSGLAEYIPDTHERVTMSFALAQEAEAALIERGFELNKEESFLFALAEHEEKQRGFASMDPEVAKLLATGITLFPHQNRAIEFIEKSNGRCLVGAAMGAGKTPLTLAWAAKHNLRVCVVCPKVVRRNWVKEAGKFFPKNFKNAIELDKKSKSMPQAKSLSLVSVNYEGLTKWADYIRDGAFDLLIVDESQCIKDFKSQRSKLTRELSKSMKYACLLSGTAVKNDRYELHPQIQLLDPERYPDKSPLFNQSSGKFWHDIQSIYLSMPKNEVLSFLPPQTICRQDIEVSSPVGVPPGVEEVMRYRTQSAHSKVAATLEKAFDILDNSDESMIIFSESVEVCHKIHQTLERNYPGVALYHDGHMPNDRREEAKERFQNDPKIRVFVSTRQSLAVGATLTKATQGIFNDFPWNAADVMQAQDRFHRIGQHKPVFVHWVVAANSEFDCALVGIIEKKYRLQKAVTEGKKLSKTEEDYLKRPSQDVIADLIREHHKQKRRKAA